MQLKVSSSHLERVEVREPSHSPYSQPPRGTNMDQFRDMVSQFVDEKVGTGDHKKLVDRIMDVADVNHDQKVHFLKSFIVDVKKSKR